MVYVSGDPGWLALVNLNNFTLLMGSDPPFHFSWEHFTPTHFPTPNDNTHKYTISMAAEGKQAAKPQAGNPADRKSK